MNRALKFLLVFVVVVLAVFAMAGIPNYSAFKTLFSNADGMAEGSEYIESTYSLKGLTEFIGEHPEFFSVVSFNIDKPDSGIFYQADVSRTLGTLSNVFLLLEYERQVEAGLINPKKIITLEEVTRFALPEISAGSHKEGLEKLQEIDPKEITIDHAVGIMVEVNDLTIADYLWFVLGKDNLTSLIDTLGFEHTDLPLPFVGLYISINPNLADTSKIYTDDEVIEFATRFKNDETYNREVKAVFEDERIGISFIQERNALANFPQTTPREIAIFMMNIQKNEIISEAVSKKVQEKMRWVFGGETIPLTFSDYGAIYDNRMGMLSGIDFGTSIYTGASSAQAVFFDRLPVAFWLHLSANHMQEDYQQRLIWDPALFETTIKEISKGE